MKQIVLCIALAIGAFAQTAQSTVEIAATMKTGGNWNGRFWKELGANDKTVFVLAYGSAVTNVSIAMSGGNMDRYKKISSVFWPNALTGTEVVSALNNF
jgi:ABC-type tungstate transport system substrate-binding protein